MSGTHFMNVVVLRMHFVLIGHQMGNTLFLLMLWIMEDQLQKLWKEMDGKQGWISLDIERLLLVWYVLHVGTYADFIDDMY